MVENLPIPVFIKEARELRFVLWNRAGEELTGIPSAEMIGKSDHDFFPAADAALYVARDRAALTSRGVLETAEETIQTRHHGARITHVWKVPIFDAAGQPTHLLGISEDITERKRIAVTLQQSEERFRLLVEQSPDVIGIYQDTRLVFINATGVRLLGAQTPAELLGRKSEQMVHPDDFPDVKDRIQRRLAGETGVYPAEVRYLRLDGTTLLMEVSAAPITYEGQPAVQFIARDIGDRKRSEEQLRVQASALDAAANAIVITDQRGTIQSVNAAFTTLTGYTAAEAVGQNPRLLNSGQQDATFFRNLWQRISSGQVWSGEMTNRRKDGSLYFEEMTITPLLNAAGGIVRYIAIKQDISARKRAEAALQENADLATLEAEVGTAITQAGSLGEMLQRCSEAVVVHLDGAFTRVWILNEAAQMLELQASAGCYTHLDGPHGRVPVGQFKIGRIAQERKAYLTNQVVGDPRVADQAWAQREGMVAFAGYPLMLADRVIGVAAIFARHPLGDATLQALAVIANTIAVGIERKQAEAALRESRQILEGILNAIPVRVFWKDRNLVYLGCNAIFARDAGFTDHHDIIGKDDYQLGWREQAELYRASDREIIVSGRPQLLIEEPQTTQDGKLITLLTSKLPLRSATGEICGVLGTYVDITERKQAEEALHQRVKLQEQLVHLAATVPGMIYSLRLRPDGSTQLPFASRVLSDIFELQPEDVLEDAAAIFALVHPDDIGHLQGTMNESARTLTPWRDDFRVCRRRRGEIWVEGHSVPKREPDGSILWQGYVQNITERKLAEATLQESERLLQSTLDALSAHLAILDAHGTIIKVNAAWNRFATANQFQGDHHGVGDNYLTVCDVSCWP
ncbi:MAG: PAS domain S-box protein [Verrucomicrobiota bacterium]